MPGKSKVKDLANAVPVEVSVPDLQLIAFHLYPHVVNTEKVPMLFIMGLIVSSTYHQFYDFYKSGNTRVQAKKISHQFY